MSSHQQPSRHPSRQTRRVSPRTVPARTVPGRTARTVRAVSQKPDYSEDYAYVRRDLKRIVLWSTLLMIAMVGGYFLF